MCCTDSKSCLAAGHLSLNPLWDGTSYWGIDGPSVADLKRRKAYLATNEEIQDPSSDILSQLRAQGV